MFKKQIHKIGTHLQTTLENNDKSIVFSVLPNLGGCVSCLKLNGISILEEFADVDEIEINPAYKNVFLLPFPNRLKDGQYNFNRKSYQFPINDQSNHNALHGFTDFNKLEVTHFKSSESNAQLTLKGNYDGSNPAYPFSFETSILFQLSANHKFKTTITIKNTDTTDFPIGIGWHPYFKLDGKIDNYQLQLPDVQQIICDNRMIPIGKEVLFSDFKYLSSLKNTQFDTGFRLEVTKRKAKVLLKNNQTTIEYWQETGVGKFNYLQIYTPSHRNSIAIEPMTCNIDAFNNKEGVVILKPNEGLEASFGVSIKC